MAVIYCYLERENYKVLNFHMNNFPYFELSASLILVLHLKAKKLIKRRGGLLKEIP